MTPPRHDAVFIANADLHAYLDGELEPTTIPQIEARLLVDADARVLVKSLEIQRDALLARYPLPAECPKTEAMKAAVLGLPKSDEA